RERGPIDLEMLAQHFLGAFARRHGKSARAFTPAALARLGAHSWPGNIRELENCIESAVVLADDEVIDAGDLPMTGPPAPPAAGAPGPEAALARLRWDEMEAVYIAAVLQAQQGNRSRAARAMGIGRSTLLRK